MLKKEGSKFLKNIGSKIADKINSRIPREEIEEQKETIIPPEKRQ